MKRLYIHLLVAAFAAVSFSAPTVQSAAPVVWSLPNKTIAIKAGDTATLAVKVAIDKEWYIYGTRSYINADGLGPQSTEFFVEPKNILSVKSAKAWKMISGYDSSFEVNIDKIKGSGVIRVLLKAATNAKVGTYKATATIAYQSCTNINCLPPTDQLLAFELQVLPNAANALAQEENNADANNEMLPKTSETAALNVEKDSAVAGTTKSSDAANIVPQTIGGENADADDGNIWTLIWLAVGLGIGSWVMPCVYPMIPITVSFFTKRAEKDKTHPVVDSIMYSLGIMSTFVVFGVVAALFFGASAGRDFATNPWLNLFLAAMFLAIAGNLFGMYEITMPSGLVNRLNKKSGEAGGYGASVLMGMVFSLTSFTCTVPFVDLVSKMAAGGSFFRPIFAMIVYSAVFALPFFLLALFPKWLKKIPRSGAWMNNIKVVFGFVELAFAVSYFARVDSLLTWDFISREVVLAIWAGCSILLMLYTLGVFRTKLDSPVQFIGASRAVFSLAFAATAFYLFAGMQGNTVGGLEAFVYVDSSRPQSAGAMLPGMPQGLGQEKEIWHSSLQDGFAAAKKSGKPIFIDFTGKSCTNCVWMEKNIFPKPAIQSLMDKYTLVKLFTDRRNVPEDETNKQMQETRFNSTLLPLYVILTPDDKVVGTNSYTRDESEFLDFLKKGLATGSALTDASK